MKYLLILTFIVGVILQWYFHINLPERVAINFNFQGEPNSWAAKDTNALIGLSSFIGITVIFLSVPTMLRTLPIRIISFPKRDYWLAEGRKEKSITLISNWLYFFGIITNLFIILVSCFVYSANISSPVKLNIFYLNIIFAVYFIILIGWIIALFVKFNKVA